MAAATLCSTRPDVDHIVGPSGPSLERPTQVKPPTLLQGTDSGVVPGPDIKWIPSLATYLARVERLSGEERVKVLPEGFPEKVTGPRQWQGSDFTKDDSFILRLSADDIDEIESALEEFKVLMEEEPLPHRVKKANFPLPNLSAKLDRALEEIHTGRGFCILRGLEPRKYSIIDNALIYAGVTSYIGETRGLQGSGNPMINIRDAGNTFPGSKQRQSPYSNTAQPFHNDMCNILAMYFRETAPDGGESLIASTATVYNEIAELRPDVIKTLSDRSWVWDKHRTPAFWETRSLLFNFKEHGPGFCFSRRPITSSPTSPRGPDVPPMTERQAEAIDMVQFTAANSAMTIKLQRGDIQLLNNFAVFHARRHFNDSGPQKRHAMRLWLRNEEKAWETPKGLSIPWQEVYSDPTGSRPWEILWEEYTPEQMLCRRSSCA